VRVAATAGAGRRQACEQRMAIRDFGTHTLTSFFLLFLSSSLSDLVCKITYVCVFVWEKRKEHSFFLSCGGDVRRS
jgi:hypothetical protein